MRKIFIGIFHSLMPDPIFLILSEVEGRRIAVQPFLIPRRQINLVGQLLAAL